MTSSAATTHVGQVSWKGRPAWQIRNDCIEALVLEGGGHIAGLHFLPGAGPTENVLWEAPWDGVDPKDYNSREHEQRYGAAPVGKFLASFTGHALCLDLFGAPSDEETAQGLALHGEASASQWSGEVSKDVLRVWAELPHAQLHVERAIAVLPNESVLHVEERVTNRAQSPREIHWVQHPTLGPPLLAAGESVVSIPADRAKTWPLGYGGKSLVPDDVEFSWPRLGDLNLALPFQRKGTGMVVATQLRQERSHAFVAALNWRLGLLLGYVFRVADFPWVAVWEENQARDDAPWNGTTQARGLEFGTTPMPMGRQATREAGPLFSTPTALSLAAGETRATQYLAFLAKVPNTWRVVKDVQLHEGEIALYGHGDKSVRIPARGAEDARGFVQI